MCNRSHAYILSRQDVLSYEYLPSVCQAQYICHIVSGKKKVYILYKIKNNFPSFLFISRNKSTDKQKYFVRWRNFFDNSSLFIGVVISANS